MNAQYARHDLSGIGSCRLCRHMTHIYLLSGNKIDIHHSMESSSINSYDRMPGAAAQFALHIARGHRMATQYQETLRIRYNKCSNDVEYIVRWNVHS